AMIKLLEAKDKGTAELSRDDAPINGRSLETGEEVCVERSTERGSNDTEELVNVLTSLDAANILTSGVQAVSVSPIAEIPTVGVPTGSGLVPTVIRDTEIAIIHAKEELQMLIDGLDRNNEVIAKHLQEYEQSAAELTIREKIDLINELVKYQDHHAKILKGMTLEQIREKFIPVWKQIEDFVPMASKEEGERFKRKGLRLEQGSAKKVKTSEDVSEEDLKEMMQLVPVEEVYVEALQASSDKEKELWVELKRLFVPDHEDQLWTHTQALMHDPLEWKLYDTCGVHYVFTRDQEIFMLVERDYPLRRGIAIVMIRNKLQGHSYKQIEDQGYFNNGCSWHMTGNISYLTGFQEFDRGNKMLKSFPLLAMKILLPEYFATASKEVFPLLS
nr:hypothetical protein [Tanacetum cinerariifolium]